MSGRQGRMHADEVEVVDSSMTDLVRSQFPEWDHLPIRRVRSRGTVNAILRIGEDLAARFPLRAGDPEATRRLLVAEARAIAEFARHSPIPAPEPVAIGAPGPGYPMPWSVQTWVPGTVAEDEDASTSVRFASDLAGLVLTLRAVDTEGRRFRGGHRGGELRRHDEWVSACLDRAAHLLEAPPLAALWRQFRDLPRRSPDVMTHGDLIPLNVVVEGERLSGVLDTGGFGPADPALDVIAGWHLLDDGARSVFRATLRCDDLEWERSKAWAFVQALGTIGYHEHTNPAMSSMGLRTLGRVVAACDR
jgi:aminoglycoside phosphotransferase (APT) family kinase protein